MTGSVGKGEFSESFVAFYVERYPHTVQFAALVCGSMEVGEDVTQDTFVAMAAKFDHIDSPAAYLRAVVTNMARRHHRSLQHQAGRFRLLGHPETSPAGFESVELGDVIAKLPFRQRVVIVGRYWAGWSEGELAEVLGCRQGTIKSLSSRAMDTLRNKIGDRDR